MRWVEINKVIHKVDEKKWSLLTSPGNRNRQKIFINQRKQEDSPMN